jgi:hypothetical protein
MASKERSFPPRKIADLNRQSASNFLALLRDSKHFPLAIVIGAGVSASAGLPPWSTLLKRICTTFFCHWEDEIACGTVGVESPPHSLSITFFDQEFWSEEAIRAADRFSEQDALLVAQQIKNCIREADWRYLLRKIFYNYDIMGNHGVKKSKLTQSLARFCASSRNLRAIISYNWDNVFEQEAKGVGINISSIWESKQSHPSGSLPIYYPHGYLPLEGGPVTKVVIAESDYQQEATEIYSWANLVQTQAFCNFVTVFLGTSMTDPNLRRLLRISTEVAPVYHYAFLPSQQQNEQAEAMREALFDRDLFRLGVKVIRYPVNQSSDEPYSRLPDLLELMRQHAEDEESIWMG